MTDDDVGKYEEAIRNYGEDDEMFDVETRREMTEEELYEKFGGYDDDKENLAPFIGEQRNNNDGADEATEEVNAELDNESARLRGHDRWCRSLSLYQLVQLIRFLVAFFWIASRTGFWLLLTPVCFLESLVKCIFRRGAAV
ncbi:MAG: hypothetical protein Q9221_002072 [Calogaya cf. arnoldii]